MFCLGQSLSRKQTRPFPPPKGTGEFKEGPVYKEGRAGSLESNPKGSNVVGSCGPEPCIPLQLQLRAAGETLARLS